MHQPTPGAAILDAVHDTITRYVILPSAEAVDAVSLWIAATHAQPAWTHAPRLVIRAPEKRCGKSRLLDVVEGMCHNPLITVNASPAAVYRSVASDNPPTILLDEADTIFGAHTEGNEDLRGLLNAGHQRNRPTIRWDPNSRQLERLDTFAMAALAGIGAMPDTIEDRAIVIRMRRRATGEKVAPYRQRRDGPTLHTLTGQLSAWLTGHLAELAVTQPAMPVEDRAADTWEPLVAVADLAGATWPNRARRACEVLTADRDGTTPQSDRIQLLTDCRTAFGDAPAIPTSVLLERLKADPEAPWQDYAGTGLNARRLGILLAYYDIRSTNIRFGQPYGQLKGYNRTDFADAWRRYCPNLDPTPDTDPAPEPATPRGNSSHPLHPSPPSSTPLRVIRWDESNRPQPPPAPN